MKNHVLADDNIKKLLIKLSVPAMTGMLVMALYNIVDTIFVGRGVGTLGIAGLSIVFPVQMIVLAIGQMFGIGSASVISRSLGEGDVAKANRVLATIFVFTIIISAIITTLALIFIDPLLRLFGATDAIFPYAKSYMSIIIFGSIFFITAMTSNNIIRSEGQAKTAMLAMIIGAGLNIIFDPIFIFVFKMGVAGAAAASVLAQFIAVVYVLVFFQSGKSTLHFRWRSFCLDFAIFWEVIKIGFSSFTRHIAGSIVFIIVNNTLAIYGGDLAIAAYGIIIRFLKLIFMPIFGIAQGLQPIVGYNFGANKPGKILKTLKIALIYSTIVSIFGLFLIQLFPHFFISIFSADEELIVIGSRALRMMTLAIPFVGFQIIGATMFQALGKALPALFLSMSREILLLIPMVLLLPKFWGVTGVWVAAPISDVASAVLSLVLLLKLVKKLKLMHKIEIEA